MLKEQTVGANRVQIKMSDKRILTVTFSAMTPVPRGGPSGVLPANFYATVNSDEDIVDMLAMVLPYRPN